MSGDVTGAKLRAELAARVAYKKATAKVIPRNASVPASSWAAVSNVSEERSIHPAVTIPITAAE